MNILQKSQNEEKGTINNEILEVNRTDEDKSKEGTSYENCTTEC